MRNISSPLLKKHFHGTEVSTGVEVSVKKAVKPAIPKATDLIVDQADWAADELQAYVVRKVEEFHGPQPDHSHGPKLRAIFKRFCEKYGSDAGRIAVYVFETKPDPGLWKGSPIKVGRFSKINDTYMADEVLDKIGPAR